MTFNSLKSTLLICSLSFGLISCGGNSSDDGILIEGQLTQGEAVAHAATTSLRHGANENIENVQICALGECSTTDADGMWGFVADESFTGGEVTFTIVGHGIDATATLSIPHDSSEVFVHFEHGTGNEIAIHHLLVDGVQVDSTESDHAHDE